MAVATEWSWAEGWLTSDNPEAPVILQGPVETDWSRVELELAQIAVCNEKSCGACPDCKKVLAGIHPDIVRLSESEKTLKVKQVREAREQWLSTPFGERRLIVLPAAERLTREAANALLKELEEPTVHNRFLLWSSWPSRLLPTIRSRSQIVRLGPGYTKEIKRDEVTWENLVSWKRKQAFSLEELGFIYDFLQKRAVERGVDAAWQRASMRLRDWYQIASVQGNTKLASEVLLASIRQLR